MVPPPAVPWVAGVSGLVVGSGLLALGYLLAGTAMRATGWPRVVQLGLAFPAALVLVLLLLLLHAATGGAVFSHPWTTRLLVASVALGALLLALRPSSRSIQPLGRAAWIALGALVALAVLLWGWPTIRLLPLDHAWDSDFHAGLANELINGETLPHGTVTGAIPNDYPWMYHALLAATASFMPGGRAQDAFDAVFFFQVLGSVVTLFALGWAITTRWLGAAATGLFGALAGGFGYLIPRGPAVVIDPRANGGAAAVRRWGDMLFVRSYNMSFNNLAPTFPRDLGYTLLPAFLLLAIVGFRNRSIGALIGAGTVLGMIGVSTGESLFAGMATALLLVLLPPPEEGPVAGGDLARGLRSTRRHRFGRLQVALALLVPSVALWMLWFGPLASNYLKYGGFTGSANRPVILPPAAFLGAWGIATLFALLGVVVWRRRFRADAAPRVVVTFAVVVAVLITLAHGVPLLLPKGFTTLSREHRYWPLMYLPVAVLAAVGATRAITWARERSRPAAVALGTVIVLLAIPSPLLASVALPGAKPAPLEVTKALTGERSMLTLLAPRPGMRCVAATTPDWSHAVFAFSGYRLILYRWSRKIWADSAHIRYTGIYQHIPTTRQRVAALKVLLAPKGKRRWLAVARKWRVNVVTIPHSSLPPWMDRTLRVERTAYNGAPVAVVWVKPCS